MVPDLKGLVRVQVKSLLVVVVDVPLFCTLEAVAGWISWFWWLPLPC